MDAEDIDDTQCETLLALAAVSSETLVEQQAPQAVSSSKQADLEKQPEVDPEDVTRCETLHELPAVSSETLLVDVVEAQQAVFLSKQPQMEPEDVAAEDDDAEEVTLCETLLQLPALSSETLLAETSSAAECFEIGTPTAKGFKISDDAADESLEWYDKDDDCDSAVMTTRSSTPVAPKPPRNPRNAKLWRANSCASAAGAESHAERLRRARQAMGSSKTMGF
jgi:hypothetical protein